MSVLTCQNLQLSIASVNIVDHLNFEMEPGSFWGLLGSNGVGKTTLLNCLAGLREPDSGQVLLDSDSLLKLPRKKLATKLGMLQQHTAYVFESTVLQTTLTGRHPHLGYWEREGPDDIEKALHALEKLGLKDFTKRSITSLSGGEARRVAFAALMIQEPNIYLLDEPSNHLDLRHQIQIMNLIRSIIQRDSASVLAALHDVNLAAQYCTHVLMLFGDGEWCAGTREDMLSETSLSRLYDCPVEQTQSSQGPRFYPKSSITV